MRQQQQKASSATRLPKPDASLPSLFDNQLHSQLLGHDAFGGDMAFRAAQASSHNNQIAMAAMRAQRANYELSQVLKVPSWDSPLHKATAAAPTRQEASGSHSATMQMQTLDIPVVSAACSNRADDEVFAQASAAPNSKTDLSSASLNEMPWTAGKQHQASAGVRMSMLRGTSQRGHTRGTPPNLAMSTPTWASSALASLPWLDGGQNDIDGDRYD